MNEVAFTRFDGMQDEAQPASSNENTEGSNDLSLEKVDPVGLPSAREALGFQLKAKGRNRLLEAAIPILGLSVRIRNLHDFDDVPQLHSRLINEIQNFQQEIENVGYDDATVLAARYIVCSSVDEAVLSQVWGAESIWPERPMLSIYHNETWGGEKVFAILDRVMDEAHRFLDLLELIYYCVSLGFEGKYHVLHNGQARLDALLSKVHTMLEKHRGVSPDRLVHPEDNIFDKRQKMTHRMPIWSAIALGLLAVVVIHLAFDFTLTDRIDDIATEIENSLQSISRN